MHQTPQLMRIPCIEAFCKQNTKYTPQNMCGHFKFQFAYLIQEKGNLFHTFQNMTYLFLYVAVLPPILYLKTRPLIGITQTEVH